MATVYYSDLLKSKEVQDFTEKLKELNISNEDTLELVVTMVEGTILKEIKEGLESKDVTLKDYVKSHLKLEE